jgi:hypothetical protein
VLTAPHVTVAEFRASPTLLDTLNLRSGQPPEAQDHELHNVLLRASAWADNVVSAGGFAAHTTTEQCRIRSDAYGRLRLNPSDIPVISVASISYGATMGNLTTFTDPTVWIEDGRQVIAELTGASVWSGALQFGAPVASDLFVRWSYTAGYVSTVLAASADAGDDEIAVADPSGIHAGAVLRIWDPGCEEAVTVGGSYVAGSATVPLASGLASAHTVGTGPAGAVGVSGLPADAHLAVTQAATAALIRPDSLAEDAYPDTSLKTSTREVDPRHEGSGLVLEAKRILRSYRRAR